MSVVERLDTYPAKESKGMVKVRLTKYYTAEISHAMAVVRWYTKLMVQATSVQKRGAPQREDSEAKVNFFKGTNILFFIIGNYPNGVFPIGAS